MVGVDLASQNVDYLAKTWLLQLAELARKELELVPIEQDSVLVAGYYRIDGFDQGRPIGVVIAGVAGIGSPGNIEGEGEPEHWDEVHSRSGSGSHA